MPRPERLLENARQKLDHLSQKLDSGLSAWLQQKRLNLAKLAGHVNAQVLLQQKRAQDLRLKSLSDRIHGLAPRLLDARRQKLAAVTQLLNSLSFERVLDRGFAIAYDDRGAVVSSSKSAAEKTTLKLQFKDGDIAVTPKKNKD
jgi:exodeoxyribonuclease VII large subunit